MARHQYNFTPAGPVLKAFYEDRHRISIITGPIGSAKTTTACYKMVKIMMEQAPNKHGIRPSRCMAIRNTYSELLSTTAKDFRSVFSDLGKWKGGGVEPPSFTMRFKLPDQTIVEHEMLFIALDTEAHVKKLKGHQITWFWLSEANELNKAIVDMADGRAGRYPTMQHGGVIATYAGMIGDTNQCDDDHWLNHFQEKLVPAKKLPDWSFFVQPGGVIKVNGEWVENPGAENFENLRKNVPGYYKRLLQGKPEDWIKVFLANQYGYVVTGKPVHPEYNDSVHCCDNIEPRSDLTLVLGYDFGRTPACAIMQEIGETWYIIDELVSENMSASKFGPVLKRYLARNYPGFSCVGHGDPAGANKGEAVEHSAIEILRSIGLPCEPCETNDPLQRRAAVAVPLSELGMGGKPRLLVCKKASMIRKGLAGKFCYRRLQVAGDSKYQDQPDKNKWSHPVEAAEYGLMGEGEGVQAIIDATHEEHTEAEVEDFNY